MSDSPMAKILEDAARAIVTYRLKTFENAIAGDVVKIVARACSEIDGLCPDRQKTSDAVDQAAELRLLLVEVSKALQDIAARPSVQPSVALRGWIAKIDATLSKGGVS